MNQLSSWVFNNLITISDLSFLFALVLNWGFTELATILFHQSKFSQFSSVCISKNQQALIQ